MTQDVDTFEELAKNWPDLFQKAKAEAVEAGHGWFDLLNNLCAMLCKDVTRLQKRKQHQDMEPDRYGPEAIKECQIQLANAIKDLPVILQIKEKFGSLRFYAINTTLTQENYIEFAENMSSCICEECGKPGVIRQNYIIRTLCDEHQQ